MTLRLFDLHKKTVSANRLYRQKTNNKIIFYNFALENEEGCIFPHLRDENI